MIVKISAKGSQKSNKEKFSSVIATLLADPLVPTNWNKGKDIYLSTSLVFIKDLGPLPYIKLTIRYLRPCDDDVSSSAHISLA